MFKVENFAFLLVIVILLLLLTIFREAVQQRPIGKWHEAAVAIQNDEWHLEQPEHFFVQYANGSVCSVTKEEWHEAPQGNH